jgi:indolepyruvate ferredoxin oxidoreductase beta subunit
MKKDIILAGVGGQGILTIATMIGHAALSTDMHLKQAEVHGMSQRGGDVQSHLRISDQEIFSDLIPMGGADLILSVEPMESLRYLPYISEDGWVVANKTPFINIPDYPQAEEVYNKITSLKNHILIDADAIAKECGSARSMNIVMLGASAEILGLSLEKLEGAIKAVFGRKGEAVVEANVKALKAGYEAAKK